MQGWRFWVPWLSDVAIYVARKNMKTGIRVLATSVSGILSWILILLLPAGTLHYW